jgi:hypothetical protein
MVDPAACTLKKKRFEVVRGSNMPWNGHCEYFETTRSTPYKFNGVNSKGYRIEEDTDIETRQSMMPATERNRTMSYYRSGKLCNRLQV